MLEAVGSMETPLASDRPAVNPSPATPATPVASPVSIEEGRLLAGLRRGDERSFETLYRRHVGLLHALSYRLTSKRSEAEELTQEVFVRAWEHRAEFLSLDHFVHWMRRVAVNCWINHLRKRRELELPTDDDGQEIGEFAAPPESAPATRVDLESALARLSPRLRAVALLFDFYGYGHDEIGALLEMTPGASKVQLHRARQRLREILK